MNKEMTFTDYLSVLYKWKKFIIINLLIVTLISVTIVLIIPKTYKATATIMIPPDSQSSLSGLGGLSSLVGGKSSFAALGSKIFGLSGASQDVILGILNSRSALTNIIQKFNLIEYYEIDDENMDKAIKAFSNDIYADANEFEMIEVSILNENPITSADIANYIVKLVDSINIKINTERATNSRIFIEKRYLKNIEDLKVAEDSLYKFQKKFGIVAIPEQLEVTVKAAAEIESQVFKKEMESYFAKELFGESSPQFLGLSAELEMLRKKVRELKNSSNLGETSNILYPFKKMPDIALEYMRTYREVEIQQSILEIVMPMYEQAKVEEQKSMPTIILLDRAVPPQLKYGPKRAAIVIGIFLLIFFFLIPFVFWGEKAINRKDFENTIQISFSNFIQKIVKLYRLKF
ncbi:MAG: hypothetical protein IPM32_00625 [Ignavibacteriae bacterium]|nr:hypothetical protein [Ignavibacteriota bacterium]